MTPELQRRLDNSLSPFDGSCIHNAEALTISQLRELLVAALAILEPRYLEIRLFHDWHDHDGFIVESEQISWANLHSALATEEGLFESRDDDFAVYIALYPPNFEWLMRYNIDSEDNSDYRTANCDFDFTLARNTSIQSLLDSFAVRFTKIVERNEPASWFRSNYGG